MRNRSIIHISGQKGAGKTTFIEALLRSEAAFATCVRADKENKLRVDRESGSRRHPEVRRYCEAGAAAAAHYRFGKTDPFSFFESEVMQEYSEAVIIEGDCPIGHSDLSIFVARPLPKGQKLLRRVKRDHKAEHQAQLVALERAATDPSGLMDLMASQLGAPFAAMFGNHPKALAGLKSQIKALIPTARKTRPAAPTLHWTLDDSYSGIEHAQLVVINAYAGDDLGTTQAMVKDIGRLRSDREVFDDILGIKGNRTLVTAVVTNLQNPADPGLKKAITRVKRTLAR